MITVIDCHNYCYVNGKKTCETHNINLLSGTIEVHHYTDFDWIPRIKSLQFIISNKTSFLPTRFKDSNQVLREYPNFIKGETISKFIVQNKSHMVAMSEFVESKENALDAAGIETMIRTRLTVTFIFEGKFYCTDGSRFIPYTEQVFSLQKQSKFYHFIPKTFLKPSPIAWKRDTSPNIIECHPDITPNLTGFLNWSTADPNWEQIDISENPIPSMNHLSSPLLLLKLMDTQSLRDKLITLTELDFDDEPMCLIKDLTYKGDLGVLNESVFRMIAQLTALELLFNHSKNKEKFSLKCTTPRKVLMLLEVFLDIRMSSNNIREFVTDSSLLRIEGDSIKLTEQGISTLNVKFTRFYPKLNN